MSLKRDLISLARDGGGSFKTRADRENIVGRFADHLKNDLNIQIRTASQIKTKHIEAYIEHRLNEGIGKRTLQNEMAALRNTLTKAGREEFAHSERLANQSLGLAGASRDGTKTAIPEEKFQEALKKAKERDEGFAACLQLARTLGLRAAEAVRCNQSLATWSKQLNSGSNSLKVIFGTKGKRPREVEIQPENRAAVISAVIFAIEIAKKQGGVLINKDGLKQAMTRFSNEARAVGLSGIHSPHSLRYRFAQDQLKVNKDLGYTDKEALALVSCDLGHGDGRGHYIEQVYTK